MLAKLWAKEALTRELKIDLILVELSMIVHNE